MSKFKTAVDVYLDKTQPSAEEQSGEHLYWGHALEAPIIDRFIQETGHTVQRQPPIRHHPQHPWALANADGLILDSHGHPAAILEIKTASAYNNSEWGEEGSDEVPLTYIAQVQWYMAVYDLPEAWIAVLIGGQQYRQYKIEREDELISAMLQKGRHFWHHHVLAGIPPEPANGNDTFRLYPQDNGDTAEADTETLTAYNELKALKEQAKALDAQITAREDLLKTKIGIHSTMQTNGSPLFTWKSQSSNRFDSTRFKAEHPDMHKQYTKTTASRVLRLK